MGAPLLYDIFCCAGGAGMGYSMSGFRVIGIDNNAKVLRNYPFESICMDALEFLDRYLDGEFETADAFHASPPCQRFSSMTKGRWQDRLENHPDLINPIREKLQRSGKPFIIENVAGAKDKLINPILLCGTMFGLQTKAGSQLRRHRYFEMPWYNALTPPCAHGKSSTIGVYGGGQNPDRKRVPATIGVWGHAGGTSNRDGLIQFGTQDRRDAMGIDWMSGDELSEAIPPAYTRFIGSHLLKSIGGDAANTEDKT